MKRVLFASTVAALALTLSSPVFAHAFLKRASPAVGSTVATAPRQLTLWFTEDLEPAFSRVEVSNAKGTRVDVGKAHISGDTMRVDLKHLPPGTYLVRWHALSVDTHRTQGKFSFKVDG
jgi:methionine-rich copper-binding protein CopC